MATRKAIVDSLILLLSLLGFVLVIYTNNSKLDTIGISLLILAVVFIFWRELAYSLVTRIQAWFS
ncbi:hypothetical protein HZA99_02550 [Candidatus Woesearchaeota archaeon]|nr:hypothetical protein [Candidatus Woesearchaeota archaeon]